MIHLKALISRSCGMIIYCHILVHPEYCLFCLGEEGLSANQRMKSWIHDHKLWVHIIFKDITDRLLVHIRHVICSSRMRHLSSSISLMIIGSVVCVRSIVSPMYPKNLVPKNPLRTVLICWKTLFERESSLMTNTSWPERLLYLLERKISWKRLGPWISLYVRP